MAPSMEKMESSNRTPVAGSGTQEPSWEYHLRKYLMLLATLVATATYAAGLSPPGGVWQEDEAGHTAGVPILDKKPRYLAFFYLNATAFAASLVVNLLLLVLNERMKVWLAVLRLVMVLDLLALMGAYAAGSCRDMATTVYVSVLVVALAAYVGIRILLASYTSSGENSQAVCGESPGPDKSSPELKEQRTSSEESSQAACSRENPGPDESSPKLREQRTSSEESSQAARGRENPGPDESSPKLKEQRKVLMLLATFAVGISYGAGLSPPGGFSDDAEGAGYPVLEAQQYPRLMAFFYCNTASFVASLLVIVLLLGRRLQRYYNRVQLYGFILVALFGLLGAYAAGSSRKADTTVYVIALVGAVPAYILLVMVVMGHTYWQRLKTIPARASKWLRERGDQGIDEQDRQIDGDARAPEPSATPDGGDMNEVNTSNKNEGMEKVKSLVLLLATLAATITYQAGMDPPGGVWPEDGEHYKAGDPILLSTHAKRYKVFFYCNSTAFVASLVVILMVQNRSLIRRHTLEVAMILVLFGLIGAYAAGSCRDVSTSIYVMALAGAVLVYIVIHVVFFTLDHEDMRGEDKKKLHKRRKRLLLLAILVATITYQAGLTPPGGFWLEDSHGRRPGHGAGYPILQDHGEYRERYQAFFYLNSTSFMSSVALIIMLVNPNLYRPGIRCYALYVCMVVSLFGLMGAYAAGSARHVQRSIYVFVLVGAVIAFIVVLLLVSILFGDSANGADGSSRPSPRAGNDTANESSSPSPGGGSAPVSEDSSGRRKYLMLLAILAASVTYQAGLEPPGSVWQDTRPRPGGYTEAGSPVMHDRDRPRYYAFFYCNSTSMVASVVVIVLLLQESLQDHGQLLYAMNTAIVLDLLGLLGAYAAGSSREWKTSMYVVALVAAVIAYVAIHLVLWFLGRRERNQVKSSPELPSQPKEQGDVRYPPRVEA